MMLKTTKYINNPLGRIPYTAYVAVRCVFESGKKHDQVAFPCGTYLGYQNRKVSVRHELWKAFTHFLRWAIGRSRDLDSNQSHLAHVIARLMIILEKDHND